MKKDQKDKRTKMRKKKFWDKRKKENKKELK